VLTRPEGLPDSAVISALSQGWSLNVDSVDYRALGFGSHHWYARGADGHRWFLTVDDLHSKLRSSDDSYDAAFERLLVALSTARAVRDEGAGFVAAPVPAGDGTVLRRIGERFTLALYPYIEGHSPTWGEYTSASDRLAALELIVAVHASSPVAAGEALVDEFMIPHRDALWSALGDLSRPWTHGPYSEPARDLLGRHAGAVKRMLAHYDALADEARTQRPRFVLTHGEPHVANTIRTDTGLMLIDWDTCMVAPPERDLWMLDSGDGQVLAAYTDATGAAVRSSMLDLYRLSWDVAEVAIYISQFRGHHAQTLDDQASWKNLNDVLDPPRRWPSVV